jgi:hypothetical protein
VTEQGWWSVTVAVSGDICYRTMATFDEPTDPPAGTVLKTKAHPHGDDWTFIWWQHRWWVFPSIWLRGPNPEEVAAAQLGELGGL